MPSLVSGSRIGGDATSRLPMQVALYLQADHATHALQFGQAHAAELGEAHAEVTQPKSNIAVVRVELCQ